MKRNIKYFTLLELIFTIGIMLTLSGLLLPCMLRCIKEAKSIACINNLKQLGYSFSMYCADFNWYLPHKDNGNTKPPYGCIWYLVLDDYIKIKPPYKIKQDPSYLHFHNSNINFTYYSYKFNSRLEDYKGKKLQPSPSFRALTTIRHPSLTVLLFDGRIEEGYKNKPYGMYTSIVCRHIGCVNILMCDFQVKRYGKLEEKSIYWKGPGGLFWDPDVKITEQ